MKMQFHVIYGLSLVDSPRAILYVGSCLASRYEDRMLEHRGGNVPTTRKMAIRDGASLHDLRARILRRWLGPGGNPEARVMRLVQAFGMGQWCGKHQFSSTDGSKGALARNARHGNPFSSMLEKTRLMTSRKNGLARMDGLTRQERSELARIGGLAGGRKGGLARKANMTPERLSEIGRKAGRASPTNRTNHIRWHVNRGITNPACGLCAEVSH